MLVPDDAVLATCWGCEWGGTCSTASVMLSEPPVEVSFAALRKYPVIFVHFVPGHIFSGLVASKLMYSWPTLWWHWDL